jgi:hypothetical protein
MQALLPCDAHCAHAEFTDLLLILIARSSCPFDIRLTKQCRDPGVPASISPKVPFAQPNIHCSARMRHRAAAVPLDAAHGIP